jgi:hypothetical protein
MSESTPILTGDGVSSARAAAASVQPVNNAVAARVIGRLRLMTFPRDFQDGIAPAVSLFR